MFLGAHDAIFLMCVSLCHSRPSQIPPPPSPPLPPQKHGNVIACDFLYDFGAHPECRFAPGTRKMTCCNAGTLCFKRFASRGLLASSVWVPRRDRSARRHVEISE